MTLEQIKEELAFLPADQLDHLAAYLAHLRHQRDPAYRQELARRIDDSDPAHWVSLDQLREHWKD
jgi:hypothetical protein